MKKFALFMMMATIITACGSKNQPDTDDEEQEVALTAEDSAAVIKALYDSIFAEVASLYPPVLDEEAEDLDSAMAAFEAALEQYCRDTAIIFSTREARLASNLAYALSAKKAGEEKMDSTEQK